MTEPFESIGFERLNTSEAAVDGAEDVANDRAK